MESEPESDPATHFSRSWVEGFWDTDEREKAFAQIHPDCEFLGWGRGVQGKEGCRETIAKFEKAFESILVTVVDVTGADGKAAGHARFAARHRASQREVDVFFSFFLQWENGVLIWSRSILDTASLLAQLNLLDLKRWDLVFDSPYSVSEEGP